MPQAIGRPNLNGGVLLSCDSISCSLCACDSSSYNSVKKKKTFDQNIWKSSRIRTIHGMTTTPVYSNGSPCVPGCYPSPDLFLRARMHFLQSIHHHSASCTRKLPNLAAQDKRTPKLSANRSKLERKGCWKGIARLLLSHAALLPPPSWDTTIFFVYPQSNNYKFGKNTEKYKRL